MHFHGEVFPKPQIMHYSYDFKKKEFHGLLCYHVKFCKNTEPCTRISLIKFALKKKKLITYFLLFIKLKLVYRENFNKELKLQKISVKTIFNIWGFNYFIMLFKKQNNCT